MLHHCSVLHTNFLVSMILPFEILLYFQGSAALLAKKNLTSSLLLSPKIPHLTGDQALRFLS